MTAITKPTKPLMLYDGECQFCKAWVEYWSKLTGDRISYASYQSFEVIKNPDGQEVLRGFPQVSVQACSEAVQILMPDGRVYAAAEAVFQSLAAGGRSKVWLWLYQRLPGFRPVSKWAYRVIAHHRGQL